jgi:four helix bundle protein
LKQIVRSGTSIGANIEEGQAAESKADFRHKYSIALKEARETRYWLALLDATNMAPKERTADLRKEVDELSRIIGKIIVNSKKTNK